MCVGTLRHAMRLRAAGLMTAGSSWNPAGSGLTGARISETVVSAGSRNGLPGRLCAGFARVEKETAQEEPAQEERVQAQCRSRYGGVVQVPGRTC